MSDGLREIDGCRLEISAPGIELSITGDGPVEWAQRIMHVHNVCSVARQMCVPAITDEKLGGRAGDDNGNGAPTP